MSHLLLLFLATLVTNSLANQAVPSTNTSYIIITSDVLVPGHELLINLHLLDLTFSNDEQECILDLKVSDEKLLWHRSSWRLKLDKTPKSFMTTLRMLVPEIDSPSEKHVLRIQSNTCFNLDRSVELPVKRKDLLVSVDTDKLSYFPGDLVLIQTLVYTFAQVPHIRPVNLSLYDSENVLLVKWPNVSSKFGMIIKSFRIPLLYKHGNLTIVFENHEQRVNHTVEVRNSTGPYDKDKFLVDVRAPRYHVLHSSSESKSPNIEIYVVTSKRSGVPLSGKVRLLLTLDRTNKSVPLHPIPMASGHKVVSIKPDEVKELLGLSKDDSLVGREIDIEVVVEEVRFLFDEIEENQNHATEEENEKPVTVVAEKHDDKIKMKVDEIRSRVSVTRKVKVAFVDQSHVLFFTEFTPLFFKPGLTYVGQVLLKEVKETIPRGNDLKEVTVNVKHFTLKSEIPREEKLTLMIKPNSVGEFAFLVPKEDTKVELEALFDDKESGKVVKAELKKLLPVSSHNQDGHFIQVYLNQKPAKVLAGQVLKGILESTFPYEEFLYTVHSQSMLVLSGVVSLTSQTRKHEFSIEIPLNVGHLLSSAHLVVMVTSPSHELLTASLQFVVEHEYSQRPLKLVAPEVAEPGSEIKLVIRAEPYTTVYLATLPELLVYDPKELELRKEIAREKLLRHLRKVGTSPLSDLVYFSCESCSTIPSLAPDSQRTLNESGSLVLTDGVVSLDQSKPWPVPPCKNGTLDDLQPSSLDSIEFFETNLWELDLVVGQSGEELVTLNLPEKHKLYTMAAFGFRAGRGFASSEISHLVVSPKVAASLEHPESIFRGEEFVLEVHLYNTQEYLSEVELSMTEKPGFKIVCLEGEEEMEKNKIVRKIKISPKRLQVVPVYIKSSPTCHRPLRFEMEIIEGGVRRLLNSSVKIKQQGYMVTLTESELLDNFKGRQVLKLDVSKNITNALEDSESSHIRIYGHPLGPAIRHVCSNVNTPDIVEERTKLSFVLAVNILDHISNNPLFFNSVDTPWKIKELPIPGFFGVLVDRHQCVASVRESVEYLLNRRRNDGSYSFYNSSPGYVWLTTLMLDALVQLKDVVTWEKGDILLTLRWLINQQQIDGSFEEQEGSVLIRKEIEGSKRVPLTSQVVISLLEAAKNLDLSVTDEIYVKMVAEKSVAYLESVILKGEVDNDSYTLSLASYALGLARCDKLSKVLLKRDRLVVNRGDEKYWGVNDDGQDVEDGMSVLTTSYAILTSLTLNDLPGARPYVNHLTRRMNHIGAFVSTLDTNIALRALSRYHSLQDRYHEHRLDIDVNITLADKRMVSIKVLDPLFVGCIYFYHSNFSLGSQIKIETSGRGVVLVQNVPEFYQAVPSFKPVKIDLKVETKQKSSELLEINVCAVNLEEEATSSLFADVPLLTGYDLDMRKVGQKENLQILKQQDEIHLVFFEIPPSSKVCVDLELEKIFKIANLEPKHVRLYSVKEPSKPIYKSYNEDKVENHAKKICPQCKC